MHSGRRSARGQQASIEKPSTIRGEAQRLLYDWKWLSLFFDHVNTSMGKPPPYPFEIPPPVIRKLGFVHRLIREAAWNMWRSAESGPPEGVLVPR